MPGMYSPDIAYLRSRIKQDKTLPENELYDLLDLITELRRQLETPQAELHLSAMYRTGLERWAVAHQLLEREILHKSPVDAIILAAANLRTHYPAPEPVDRDVRISMAEWDALARDRNTLQARALREAIKLIEDLEQELTDLHDDRLLTLTGRPIRHDRDGATIARLRARSCQNLAARNIESINLRPKPDGFGDLDDYGLGGRNVLMLATEARTDRLQHTDYSFTPNRRWIALITDHDDAWIATPLDVTAEIQEGLDQLARAVPQRKDTIVHLDDYLQVVETLGSGVTCEHQVGPVGGGWWPFDIESLPALTDHTLDEIADWAEPASDATPLRDVRWQLVLLGPERDWTGRW